MARIRQDQVPEGMQANVPWGQPFDRWSDRMIVRGWQSLNGELRDHRGNVISEDESDMFPNTVGSLYQEASKRGIVQELLPAED